MSYPFQCAHRIAPYVPSRDERGMLRLAWPGFGTEKEFEGRLVPCGYQSRTREQHLAHLVATHQIPLEFARRANPEPEAET